MDRIPIEIIRAIFQLASLQDTCNGSVRTSAEISEGRQWPGLFDLDRGPWVISRVCREWKIICTSAPELWSSFILSADNLPPGRNVAAISKLTTWLSFSRTTALSFLIKTDGICNHPDRSELFRVLMKHSDRWGNIEVINSTFGFWLMLDRNNIRERLRSLKRVTFLSEGSNRGYVSDATVKEPFNPSCYHVFANAPRLHALINHDYFPLSQFELPWSQITEFDGSEQINFSDHVRILHRTPNLKICRLEIAIHGFDRLGPSKEAPSPSITLNYLTTLRIHFTNSMISESDSIETKISNLMTQLVLPSLTTLSLKSSIETISAPFAEFAAVLRSSQCELLELELSSLVVAQPDDIVELLKTSPSLQRLCMSVDTSQGSRVIQDTILPGLVVNTPSDDTLIPFLQSLQLVIPTRLAMVDFDLPCLSAGIRSRWAFPPEPGFFIRKLHVFVGRREYDDPKEDEQLPDMLPPILEVLQEEGLKVVVQKLATSEFL
ncbi:hypothetical protein PM082_009299 [Marasmius tenuissimus]|nr:hypothetical protein PM082_009299 [Marasmius tenuissimus]